MRDFLTYPQFIATERPVNSISAEIGEEDYDFPGLIYMDCYWIEKLTDGRYHLLLGSYTEATADLERLRSILYLYVANERRWS